MCMTIKNLFTQWYSRQHRLYGTFCALMFLAMFTFPTNVWAAYSGSGSGTSEDPYLVTSEAQLTEVLGTCGGYAKLTANFLNSTNVCNIQVNTTVTLDLNGKTIENYYTSSHNHYQHSYDIFIINSGANLTITDNSSEKNGTIKCADGPKGAFHNKGTLTILGGIITQNSGNVGGGIYNDDGAVLTISGGTISENSYYGIYNAFGATCNITGGTITNNGSSGNGGIYNLGTLNISGAPNISGNRSYNIYLPTGKTITVAGVLSNTTLIGITMQTPGDFTNAYEGAYTHFVSDNTDYEVIDNSNKALIRSCWAGLNVLLSQEGTVTLTKDYKAVSTDGHLLVESGKTVTLDLNGHTLNRNLGSAVNEGCVIKNQGNLTITGTGGGVIKGGYSSSGGGGILNEGTLTINGGTIKENKTTSLGAGIYNVTGKTLTLDGGVIDNNQNTTNDGGGIYNQGTFTLTSGSITNNKVTGTSKNGGGIYNTGTMSINGGTIQNNTATGLGAGIYHDGTAFNLQGSPTISSNTVSSSARNVYLTTTNHTITITGALSNTTAISLNMETLGVFTSGLSGNGTSAKFSSEAGNSVKLIDNGSNEAELITYWNYLNRQLSDGNIPSITLEPGIYQATSSDSYLHIPSGRTVELIINGQTLNRGLYNSTAIASGCVIFNEGTLTINGNSGTIKGGNNDDSNDIKGGGICNKGTLTYEIGTIGNNKTATLGGGIYNTGTLSIKGGTINNNTASGDATANGIYHNGSQFNLEGNPNINVYLATGKTITISNTLSNSSAIKIATADEYLIFTSGLSGKGDASNFTANQDGKGIGLNSSGEAIIGPTYNIERVRDFDGTTSYLYIKGDHNNNKTAVYGERVKVQITTNGVPMSLSYPGAPPSYPKASVDYEFDMPSEAITVTAKCRPGGYCGTGDEDIKWAVDNGTLTFITKEETADYTMKSYAAGQTPWVDKTYTSVSIPKKLVAISDYAFCDKNQNLTTFTVEAGNTAFKVVDGLLYSHDGYTLYCYPSGKTNATTYTLPSEVTTVKDGAFAFNITLQNIAVAGGTNYKATDGVLYNYAGTSLICYPAGKTETSYTIVATVAEIKPYAFQNCVALQDVYVLRESSVLTGGVAMFDGTDCRIMVIASLVNSYKAADYWKNYEGRITAIDMTSVTITLSSDADDYDYMGSPVRPAVTEVKRIFDNYILKSGVDYSPISESSYTNNTYLGTGTITINGLGNYAGLTATKNYDITKRVIITGATGNYSTYYHNETVTLDKPSGLAVYTITSVDWETGNTTLSDPLGSIPPNTPVLLYKNGNCNGTYHLKVVTASSASPSPDFKGVTADTPYNTLMSDNKAIYVIKGGQFYRATSGTLKANHCYLAMPNSSSYPLLSRMMVGGGDGDATGIDVPIVEEEDGSDWYSLDGRKLQKRPVQKGVYISNGKKVVIK